MGVFLDLVFDGQQWVSTVRSEPWLKISIHDSDIAEVTFAPAGEARGLVYLGYQPRDYFDNPAASPEIDLDAEAGALVRWAAGVGFGAGDVSNVRELLAEVGAEPEADFVEETVVTLLEILGIPSPPDL